MYIKDIENLTTEDYPEIFKLSEYAFQYHLSEEDYIKKCEEAKRHQIYGIEIKGRLAGKLHIIPLEVFIQGKLLTMGGISYVATCREYSGKGIAGKLIKQRLKNIRTE